MANQQSPDEPQFIVVPRARGVRASKALAELRQIAASRQITVVRVVGPHAAPVRLIVRGPRDVLAKLQERYAHELLFEEDRPLGLI